MKRRSLTGLTPGFSLFLTAAAMLVLCSLTVNAQKSSTLSSKKREEIRRNAIHVFRNDISHSHLNKATRQYEADDNDLTNWLSSFADPGQKGGLTIANIDKMRNEKGGIQPNGQNLGNGFGAPEIDRIPDGVGIAYLLPKVKDSGIGEAYILANGKAFTEAVNAILAKDEQDPVSNFILISRYEPLLRRRMDNNDSNGRISEDEFVNYVVDNWDYGENPPASAKLP